MTLEAFLNPHGCKLLYLLKRENGGDNRYDCSMGSNERKDEQKTNSQLFMKGAFDFEEYWFWQ